MPTERKFRATLERMPGNLGWVIIHVPFDAAKIWGKRGQIRVRGSVNGFAFRTSLFPTGRGTHYMVVNKQMQRGGRALPGATAEFRMEPDTEERMVTVPLELRRALDQDKRLRKFFDTLSPSTRRDLIRVISEAKHEETRARRSEQMAERLMQVMEAEREPPPVLQAAMARNAKARRGWELMPRSQKRFHLFGLFGYKTPEARARRLAKCVEVMLDYAEGRGAQKKQTRNSTMEESADGEQSRPRRHSETT
ncbi:MAG TPA: YdeI/OmpD-associated family protein [Terriglobales bacterium]|nr:YdeI/OmpD-associated family protein [Terriglobales bacterium]